MNYPLVRCLAYLKRIAAALERMAPPPPARPRRHAEFSVSTTADFERGYDGRDQELLPEMVASDLAPPEARR